MNAEIQNCIDAWALLYASIAKTLNQEFGAEGRSALRKAIRGYASERGENRKAELCAENLSLNLKNLAIAGNDFPTDYRTEIERIKTAPQEFFANVAHCPLARVWEDTEISELGSIYCEEFYHAYLKSALFHKVQVNVTQMLTHERDELCRFSFYLRPANLNETQRKVCFEMNDAPENAITPKSLKELIKSQWALFYTHCYTNAYSQFGDNGLLALKNALTSLADQFSDYIARLRRENKTFISSQLPDADGFLVGVIPLYHENLDITAWGNNASTDSIAFYLSAFEHRLLGQL